MEKTILYRGEKLIYRDFGNGKPVLLIHGFGEDGCIFDAQSAFLKDYCRVIIPDLPGSGLSAFNGELSTISDFAEVIKCIVEKEQIASCIMLGHSMGGYITLSFAEKYPALLSGFGFIHSTAFADSEEKKENRLRSISLIETYGAYSFLKNSLPNLFSAAFKEAFPGKIVSLTEKGKLFSNQALQQYSLAMRNREDKTIVLKNASVPVLFICGDQDVAAPLNDLKQQFSLPDCSYIHILENVGHMGMWEAPEQLNNFLLEFIVD